MNDGRRRPRWIVAAFAAIALAAVSASPQDAQEARRLSGLLMRRDKGEGGVSVTVLFLTPEYVRAARPAEAESYDPASSVAFRVSIDTHSGDLGGLDMTKAAWLLDAEGREQAPLRWEDVTRSAHHRSGLLLFPAFDAGGKQIVPDAGPAEVVIRGVARIRERVFRWELPVR